MTEKRKRYGADFKFRVAMEAAKLTCSPNFAPLDVLESQHNQEVLREAGAVFGGEDRRYFAGS